MSEYPEISPEAAVKFVEALADGLRANGLEMTVTQSASVLAHSEDADSEDQPGCYIHIIIH